MVKLMKFVGSCMLLGAMLWPLTSMADSELERQVRSAVKGSKFQVETRGEAVVVIMLVKDNFKAKRDGILLPAALKPLTNISKLTKQDSSLALLVIGHTDDSNKNVYANESVSLKNANSVGSVFRVAGLTRSQLYLNGAGSTQPLATNKTPVGREKNKRVEIIMVKKMTRDSFDALSSQYAVNNYKK